MSLGNIMISALLVISYATEITVTIEGYVEQAAYGLVDVAHIRERRFESQIRSSNPRWYDEGMQIFTYEFSRFYWKRRHLTWALTNDPVVMTRQQVISAMEYACSKWAAVSPFTFQQVSPSEKADIRLTFVPKGTYEYAVHLRETPPFERDRDGVTLWLAITTEWSDRSHKTWTNIRYKLLYNMGRVLGLDSSSVRGAVMYPSSLHEYHPGATSPYDYGLTKDDIDGIQAKYGPPSSRRTTEPNGNRPPTGTYGGRPPTGTYGGRPPTGTYGGRPPTGPYGGRPPTGTYGGWPPTGSYGGRPPIGAYGGKTPTGTYGGRQPPPSSSSSSESSSTSETSSTSSDSSDSSDSSTSSSS